MLCLELAVFTRGNPADALSNAFRGENFDTALFCVAGFAATDATCGEPVWLAVAEGGAAAGEEAAELGRAAVEAVDLVGRADALPGGGDAAAGAGAGGREAVFPGGVKRAMSEAGPDKCILREGPVTC